MMQPIIPEYTTMHFSPTEFSALSEAYTTAVTDPEIDHTESDREQNEPQHSEPRFEIFSLKNMPFRDSELKAIGWKRPKNAPPVTCPESSLWVDMNTGEIFTEKQVREYDVTVSQSKSLRMIFIQYVIQSCPPKKREFVRYILRLRNTRGGLVVDLETALDRWIAHESPNMHSTDRARKRNALEKFLYDRGILANNQTFTKDLQFIADSRRADYLGEESKFVNAFPVIAKPGCGLPAIMGDTTVVPATTNTNHGGCITTIG
ncbi:hypothetical protein [Burkholderia sp. B21-005]|uniref:hypothetical protein n=1 Tax=Burkholderia sp. B21-005 TaxID=2890406 RepID=UPI001E4F7CB1|nr:hypothetical protein [Burkholderia sp. B21-005]UEP40325.1 hypothetical protein LMA02_10775 [Burkholderia sp. B21-005]